MPDRSQQLRDALSGTYVIDREIGAGGMATVYLAHDVRHDRDVALKVLHPDLANALGPERFQREIKLAARLQHPHILTVLDSGENDGQLWFTMPFVDGESLRDRLTREKQLPVADALRIAREAAQALQYAHHHGVIHRDIKPENLLLTEDGNTLVADFGIARSLGSGGNTRLTETGVALGTPAYMSPEQASGERELSAGTDIYSLAAVLYEMLAGEPPFTGPTPQAIIAKRFTGTVPSVRQARPSIPESVDQAVTQALAVIPADRFASAADFARALEPASTFTSASSPAGASPSTAAAPSAPSSSARIKPPQHRSLFATLALGVALGLGLLFGWSRFHKPSDVSDASGPAASDIRVAVLPFDNLGDTANAYFADGVADQVRGKLTAVNGLAVIARTSSVGYRGTHKSPQQIAHELGVHYLLTGTVRWAKAANGMSRVQVNPELVEVSDSGAPSSKWQQPFDASLTDVFKVQTDIATQVANALGVALGVGAKQELAERPTANLAAYDAYLRGESISSGMAITDPPTLRQALSYYQQATTLDPTFALAWARVADAAALLYSNSVPTPALAEMARAAAERARTLAPNSPDTYHALGMYADFVLSDAKEALTAYETGLRINPANPQLLSRLASAQQTAGRWTDALATLSRAEALDPRSESVVIKLGRTLLYLRQYPKSKEALDRGVALSPTNLDPLEARAMVDLARGDLAAARAVIAGAPKSMDQDALIAFFAEYWDLYWALTDAQQARLFELTPAAFDDDRGAWGIVLAQTYWLRGDKVHARVYADSARIALEQQLKATPQDPQRHIVLGLALAYLGRSADAIREGEHGLALAPISRDAQGGPYYQHQLVRIYLLLGQNDKALDNLEPLLKIPYYLSPGWLRIDPTFAPLKGNPRFERLANATS
ncbi:MAG TPA: protein kinase [Gemmatimonadaceae bacterium]|nr:protein kinase [Gemmatimonadaceae bacterium]